MTFEPASPRSVERLVPSRRGLHCPPGGFWIDAQQPVEEVVATHAHADHLARGARRLHCTRSSAPFIRRRVSRRTEIVPHDFGAPFTLGEVEVSLHPAGHILGSAQVRLVVEGEVWVVTGDFKRQDDPSCEPFELVPCEVLVTECTFARPEFAWPEPGTVIDSILDWWRENRERGEVSVLFAYVLGKSQRILAELAERRLRGECPGEVWLHPDLGVYCGLYRDAGRDLGPTQGLARKLHRRSYAGDLVLAPPRAAIPSWYERFGRVRTATVSGWARALSRRDSGGAGRLTVERFFPLSDHADHDTILRTVSETGARRVLAWHGDARTLVTTLRERGIEAEDLNGVAT